MSAEIPTTREELIWRVFMTFAQIEGKISGVSFVEGTADRAFIAAALKDAAKAVDEALKAAPAPKVDYADVAKRLAR
ncbi:hypothetical protein ACWM9A_10800 [Acetobacter pasteurianus]